MIGVINGISSDVRSDISITEKNFRQPRIELKNKKEHQLYRDGAHNQFNLD